MMIYEVCYNWTFYKAQPLFIYMHEYIGSSQLVLRAGDNMGSSIAHMDHCILFSRGLYCDRLQ